MALLCHSLRGIGESEFNGMSGCEVVEVRNLEDAVGYPCSKTGSKQCSDCGSEICESHTETCDICHDFFCPVLLLLPRSRTLQASHNEHSKEPAQDRLIRSRSYLAT